MNDAVLCCKRLLNNRFCVKCDANVNQSINQSVSNTTRVKSNYQSRRDNVCRLSQWRLFTIQWCMYFFILYLFSCLLFATLKSVFTYIIRYKS